MLFSAKQTTLRDVVDAVRLLTSDDLGVLVSSSVPISIIMIQDAENKLTFHTLYAEIIICMYLNNT